MRTLILTTAAALALLPAVSAAPAVPGPIATVQKRKKAPKGYHQDTRYGFKFKQPAKFKNIAVRVREEWLAAKYVCTQQFTYTDSETGGTANHYPEFMVIAMPHSAMNEGTEVSKDEDGKESVIKISNPYRDYDDLLKRTFQGQGGFFLAEDPVETEIDGVPVEKRTYRSDKLSRAPLTIDAWIYKTEDVDYVVHVIGLTNHWESVDKLVKPLRNTFELIEKDAPLRITSALETQFRLGRLSVDVEDKREARSAAVKSEKVIHEKAINKLPDDWNHKLSGRVLTVYSSDKKFANRVQKHANNLLDWMDENFGFLGGGTYLRKPIIRICRDDAEYFAYLAGINVGNGGGYLYVGEELVTRWDSDGWSGASVNRLNNQIYDYWMQERNFDLKTALPQWIDTGLERLISNSRHDSRKPDWRFDVDLIVYGKTLERSGNTIDLKDLFKMTEKEMNELQQGDSKPHFEGWLLVNYLSSPEIKRHKLAEGLLGTYLRNMQKVVKEIEKEQKRKLDAARRQASKGDGEREYAALRRQIFEKMEKELLQRTFDLTFSDFSDSDWKDLNAHFRKAF